ncbi:MAG: hypothetical protein GXO07_03765 [Crenarchaeota archaeon]|nr:hypothetical protein [Thermoproteota archaeon]
MDADSLAKGAGLVAFGLTLALTRSLLGATAVGLGAYFVVRGLYGHCGR